MMNQPVEVVWQDAAASHGWGTLEEKLADTGLRSDVHSLGYLVHADDQGIYFAECMTNAESYGCVTFTPWGMIRSVRAIRAGKPLALDTIRAAFAKEPAE